MDDDEDILPWEVNDLYEDPEDEELLESYKEFNEDLTGDPR